MWVSVLVACAGCYLLKVAGLSVPQRVLSSPPVQHVALLLPVALLAALAATQTVSTEGGLVLDARAAGVGVAVLALLLRAPFLVVVGSAAVTAALIRWLA
ncbi:MAG: AzlD domain-containing protein [Actinomycetes bacterium]